MFRHTLQTVMALSLSASLFAVPAVLPAQAAKLDDPTIVAIFDAANTWDMESSGLGAKKSRQADVL